MSTTLTVTVADVVYDKIEKLRATKDIGRSELVEELIRKGLEKHKR